MLTPAKLQDEADLTRLIETAFVDYVKPLGRAWPGPYPWLATAIAHGRVHWIGAREGAVVRTWGGDGVVRIEQIAIAPARQGRGLGRHALTEIEAEARADGLRAIDLHTAQPHTDLVAFYSAQGFQVTAVGPSRSGNDTVPRIYMTKPLT